MIPCADAVRQLWEYLEQELTPENREQVEEHLAFCRRCCGELEFAEELRGFMASAARPALPPDVETRLEDTLAALDGDDVRGKEST